MAAAKKATAVRQAQSPAKAGEPEVEVEERSADGSDGMRHVKEYAVLGHGLGDTDGPEHEANKAGVVQEAIQRGLHPRGDVRLDSVEAHHDGVSRTYRYSVAVVPSAVDDQPGETTTPRKVIEG
ncbi:hypothetical protein [Streptomyces sp. ME19-01-6]|uniref:hypothetical protein n=1 Tax=Streptomyces sp. ME19-01-6 TaxID=3028686 RepID=UPI0029A9D349|nr:hypothetical protein [Streptomyces sp. ME19-01-6]MDX3230625.1 hypothetical protein [Streptomyces sp. ME19-01-6]